MKAKERCLVYIRSNLYPKSKTFATPLIRISSFSSVTTTSFGPPPPNMKIVNIIKTVQPTKKITGQSYVLFS